MSFLKHLPLRFIYLFIFSITISFTNVFAQKISKRQVLELEHEAQEFFYLGAYFKALPLYLHLDSIRPHDPHYAYPIGVCYMQAYNEKKAIPYLEICHKTPERFPSRLNYYSAKAYHLNHQFDEAIKYYEMYKSRTKKIKVNEDILKKIDREIEMCRTGKELMAMSMDVEILSLGKEINSIYPEYGAVVSGDEKSIIFTSNRPNSTGGLIDHTDGRYYEDIYISTKDGTGHWSAPVQMPLGINTAGNDASIFVSEDGQKLILYRNEVKNNIISTSDGELYISELKGETWSAPVKLPEQINGGGYQPSACLSNNEKTLFFVSDRPGGLGGTDIYTVKKLPSGEWALPMNMGNVINTPYNEDSPFMHPDGKSLYFSSDGHKTMGGYDIFVSRFNDSTKTWSEPENIGYPINTAHDDIHFSWSVDEKRIYFSSIRPEGSGDKDIYYATIEREAAQVLVLKGVVFDSLNQHPMQATIKVTDLTTQELVGVFNSNSVTGKYIVILPEGKNYGFTVEAENYGLCNQIFNVADLHQFKEIDKNISLCPIKK
jgi:tetratricopeptide (TPR) repeat protein